MTKDTFEKIRKKEGDYRTGEYKGYTWEIKRHPDLLHLCGYVKFPKDTDTSKFEFVRQECTYSNKDSEDNLVLGFDCAHYKMLIPGYLYMPGMELAVRPGNIYWTMEMCVSVIRNSIDNWLNKSND